MRLEDLVGSNKQEFLTGSEHSAFAMSVQANDLGDDGDVGDEALGLRGRAIETLFLGRASQ